MIGVHVNQIFSFPSGDPAEFEGLTQEELQYLGFLQGFVERAVHDKVQQAQPQTIAHALADSPAGQLAWSGQLFGEALGPNEILTNASIYWLTNTAASAARFYYENKHAEHPTGPTTAPIGLASFAFDFRPIRRFAERDHANIVHWSEIRPRQPLGRPRRTGPPRQRHPPVLPQVPVDTRTVASTEVGRPSRESPRTSMPQSSPSASNSDQSARLPATVSKSPCRQCGAPWWTSVLAKAAITPPWLGRSRSLRY